MSALGEQSTLLAYTAGWSAVRTMPERAAYATFRTIADVMWRRRGPSVRQLEANLARALGPGPVDDATLREVTREGVRSYFRYWCDAFRMPDWSREEIVARVRPVHDDYLRDGVAAGRGVVVALPHMGNWDLAGAWACLSVAPLTTVAERLKPEALFDKFVAFREGLGMTVLPLTGGDGNILAVLGDHLRAGGLVCLPADRDLSRRGVPVTLLGEETAMPAGPAMLAVRTGAALIPATLSYEGTEPRHRVAVRFHEPIDIPAGGSRIAAATQLLADEFSAGIADHPADWHMMQRLFLADLRPDDPRRDTARRDTARNDAQVEP